MIGYKGFDKNFRCQCYQYEVGKTYHHAGDLKICDSGLHVCDNPLAVFGFYPPSESRFALVEATGSVITNGDDHKYCTNELKILKELSLTELIAYAKDTAEGADKKNIATNTSDCSAATNTGDYSDATVSGNLSVAVALGQFSRAKGALGCWLVLSHIRDGRRILKAVEVDGKTILPDTCYTLDDKGQVVRCADD